MSRIVFHPHSSIHEFYQKIILTHQRVTKYLKKMMSYGHRDNNKISAMCRTLLLTGLDINPDIYNE